LNKDVFAALKANLPKPPIHIIEIGAGIGTMFTRLIEWRLLTNADYLALDEMDENIAYASEWIRNGQSQQLEGGTNRTESDSIARSERGISTSFERADVFDFIQTNPPKSDLLIAHAVLDLFPLPESLPKLFSLTNLWRGSQSTSTA